MPYRGRGVHQFRGRGAGGLPRGCRSREQFKCRVHQEFIQMEQEYCRKLQITIDIFICTLRKSGILDEEDMNSLFSNFEEIYEIHNHFLEDLIQAKHSDCVGDIFLRNVENFKVYIPYSANQKNCLETIERLSRTNKDFTRCLDLCYSDIRCQGILLNRFLVKIPIENFCKYPTTLRLLLSSTSEDHPDYQPLNLTISVIDFYIQQAHDIQMKQKEPKC